MVASLIFMLLLATAMSGPQDRRGLAISLFFASWIAIALLFAHHATDSLPISL